MCLGSRIFTLLYYCQSDKTGLLAGCDRTESIKSWSG